MTEQVSPAAGGTITNSTASPDGYYNAGTTVQLTVTPALGYLFGSWSGDVTGAANPVSVSMTQPRSVTAILNSAATADIAVTMTSSLTQVNVGKPLAYTVTVANLGPASFAPTLTDALPGAMTFVSATASQGSCSGTVLISCALGSITAGASATVTINVTPNATDSIANTASVNGGSTDPNPANNSAAAAVTVLPAGLPPILWMGGSPEGFYGNDVIRATTDSLVWATGPKEILQYRTSDLRLMHTIAPESVRRLISAFDVTPDGSKYFCVYLPSRQGARSLQVRWFRHRGFVVGGEMFGGNPGLSM